MAAGVQTELEMMTIRTWQGVQRIPAYRYGDFAMRNFPDKRGVEIIHVPSGMCIPATFDDFEAASKSMVDIQRLRNDWSVLDIMTVAPKMAREIEQCVRRFGGLWHPVKDKTVNNIAAEVYDTKLNGYRGPTQQ